MVAYYLLDNPVTEDPTDFRAQVVTKGSKDENALVDYMISRGSTVTKAEARANLMEFLEAAAYFIEEGYTLNTPLFKAAPSISGVFTDEEDSFDPKRHRVNIKLTLGSELKDVPARIKVTKTEGNPALPLPKKVLDVTTNTLNDRLTPGGTVKVSGKRMKIDPEVPEQGAFLINGDKAVRIDTYVIFRPGELVAVLPKNLGKGTYQLEIRGTVNGAQRSGRLATTLTV